MSDERPTQNIDEQARILYRNGFLRDQDRIDLPRILSRWRLYQAVTQKTARTAKPKKEAA